VKEKFMKLRMLVVLSVMAFATSVAAQNVGTADLVNPNGAAVAYGSDVIIDPQTNGPTWVSNALIPVAAGLAQTTVAASGDGAFIYSIGGGVGAGLTPTSAVYIYNTAADTWSTGSPIPVSPGNRAFGAAVEIAGFVYVFGGYNGSMVLNTTFIYDEKNDAWSQGANMPAARFGSAVATDGVSIWVIGGFAGTSLGDETNTVWMYDPNGDAWTTGFANMPIPQGRIHAAELLDGTVHVFAGGFDGVNHFVYDTMADGWSSAPLMPFGVTDPAVVTDGTLIYLGGGGGPPPRGLGHFQIYDPDTLTWSQGPTMPAPAVDNTSGAIANGSFYVVGGYNGFDATRTNYSIALF
jgi:N-acetylneuraminic acid mutarotase